jgi:raffinose/stachyose/melibiose transport system substrate-binding protein
MKKLKLLVVGLLVLSMGLTGCGDKGADAGTEDAGMESNGGDPIEMVFFHTKVEVADGLDKMAEEFNSQFPEYKVKMEIANTSYATALQSRDAADNRPELFQTYTPTETSLKPWIESGKVVPVEDIELFTNLDEKYAASMKFSDGHSYAVPISNTGKGIMYNEDLFAKAGITEVPKTADELWAACEKLEAIGITPFVGGHQDGWTIGDSLYRCAINQWAPDNFLELKQSGEISFADFFPEYLGWIDNYLKYIDNPVSTSYATALGQLASEEAAMIINGPWVVDSISEMSEEVAGKFRMTGIPYTDDPSKTQIIEDVDVYLLVSNSTEEKIEGSKKFLSWMVSNDKAIEIWKEDLKFPNPYGIEYDAYPVYNDIAAATNAGETKFGAVGLNMPTGWRGYVTPVIQNYMMGELDV